MASPEDGTFKEASDVNVKVEDETYINILLLGETGVGKSTFINSVPNYFTHNYFKNAEKHKLITPIPSKYKIQDGFGEHHVIQIGSDDNHNEYLDTDKSSTQDVNSYVFPIRNGTIKLRFIDTPGIGDGGDLDQDNINCDNILSYIGQLHELHAICYFLKPTYPNRTVYFEYCMTQILSRLDKSASKNLIFVFTNTRSTDYGPGDTYQSLQKFIDDIKSGHRPQLDIPLGKNVFCFDNEPFRYLTAMKQNVQFGNYIRKRNYVSWKKSVEQYNNLIKYIVGDGANPPLKPHFIKSTSAINEARRLIVQLSLPLAEISQFINDSITALQRHERDLDLECNTLKQLKYQLYISLGERHNEYLDLDSNTLDLLRRKLYIPVIDLEVKELDQPVTVCASKKCAEVYKVGDINKLHYKQICHEPCFLKNVPKEIIGSPELLNCPAFNPSTKACKICGCDVSTHMHVYYLTKTVEGRIVDENVKKNIDNKEKLLDSARRLITDISTMKDELEKERTIITRTCAEFAYFLQNNAITPFSDSYKEYVEYLIMRERSLGESSKMSVIDHLQKLLREYGAAKQSFTWTLSLQKQINEVDMLVTPQKIQDSIQKLYKLKHNGRKIQEIYECQKRSRSNEHTHSEYIHEVSAQPEEDKTDKSKKETRRLNTGSGGVWNIQRKPLSHYFPKRSQNTKSKPTESLATCRNTEKLEPNIEDEEEKEPGSGQSTIYTNSVTNMLPNTVCSDQAALNVDVGGSFDRMSSVSSGPPSVIPTGDHLTKYFQGVEETVRTLPSRVQIRLKAQISQLVHNAELEAVSQ